MRAFFLMSAFSVSMMLTGAAHAHNALAPHDHPHDVSAFAGIDILLALVALPLAAYAVHRYFRGSWS